MLFLSVPFIFAFVVELFAFLSAHAVALLVNWMTYGFILYVLLYVFLLRHKIEFLEIFEHELAHTLTAFLFFKNINLFAVSTERGGVIRSPDGFNWFITLAPYFLPVFTIPFLIIKPFMTAPVHQTVDFFLGVTLAFHFAGLGKEFRHWQPDIRRTGWGFATAVVIFLNTVFILLTASFALKYYAFIGQYAQKALLAALQSYQVIGLLIGRFFTFLTH